VIEGITVSPPSTPSSPSGSAVSSPTNTSTPTLSDNGGAGSTSGEPQRKKAFLALGSKFVFDVHLDPETTDSAGRATPLEVSVLERIDEPGSPGTGKAAENDAAGSTNADTPQDLANPDETKAKPAPGATGPHRGWRVAWKTRGMMPSWMLRSERVQEFIEVRIPFGGDEEMETTYVCWETFYGALAPVVRTTVGLKLVRGFQVWMDDLRKRAEEVERSSGHYAQSLSREAETRLKMVPEEGKLEL
jgi:hypothetical protein